MRIQDGTGSNREARVDEENRLSAAAVTSTESEHNTDKGFGYIINTGDITLTSAALTTVLYIKNDSDDKLFLTMACFNLGATASGTGDVVISFNRNPTAGDIITNANDVEMKTNQGYGSSKTFTGLTYKGATGETASSGGSKSQSFRFVSNTGFTAHKFDGLVLDKGNSISIDYTPPASNTSQIVQFSVSCFFQEFVV